jgi:hypothetical protein
MITHAQYQSIICSLDMALTAQKQSFEALLRMRLTLNLMQITDARRNGIGLSVDSLLNDLAQQSNTSLQLKDFLKNLQHHVETRYGLNKFLTDNSITIPQQVATISSLVGYPIQSQHIAACP